MLNPELYWLELPGPGRLAVMPRPRGDDWLEDEIRGYARAGVNVLVSMLTHEEEMFLGLRFEGRSAVQSGMRFVAHPVPDRSVPPDPAATWKVAEDLAREFREGRSIAVHCRMGIGRSPLLLACILVSLGRAPEEAWPLIANARGLVVPDTMEQYEWVSRTARPPSA